MTSAVENFSADTLGAGSIEIGAFDTRAYEGQRINRHTKRWLPINRSGDAALIDNFWLMLSRLRDLGRNDVWTKAARNKTVRRTLGACGITTKANVKANPEFCREADEKFEYWCDYEADASNKMTWSQMQRQALNEYIQAGEVLLITSARGGLNREGEPRSIPLCYQILECEQIDDTRHQPYPDAQGNRLIRGVELDKTNAPVAYHLWQVHPYGLEAGGRGSYSYRLAANRVRHLFNPERPSMTRGASNIAASMSILNDLKWLVGNELMKSFIQSIFTVAIKREYGQGAGLGINNDDPDGSTDTAGNPLERLGSGVIADLGPNDEVETIQSNGGGGPHFESFVKLLLMSAAAGCDMSYIGLSGDYSATNFSSARAAGNDDFDFVECLQEDFSLNPVLSIRREWTRQMALLGRFSTVSPATFQAAPNRWLAAEAHCPGRKQIDPDKESLAAIKRIASGLSTWRIECAKLGLDWRDVFGQLQVEWQALADMGMAFDPNKLALGFASTMVTQATADNSGDSGDEKETDAR